MGPDELESFEARTFATWDRASLGELRRSVDRRWRELRKKSAHPLVGGH
jgi:hypothetical protein